MADKNYDYATGKHQRTDWTILGRKVGTGTGWDEADNDAIIIYDLQPCIPLIGAPGEFDCTFDYGRGLILHYDDDGNEVNRWDMIEILKDVPRDAEA